MLDESPSLDKLLGLKFTPDLKWNSYIASVARDTARMVGSLYRSKKFLTPRAILYLYKSQIRPKITCLGKLLGFGCQLFLIDVMFDPCYLVKHPCRNDGLTTSHLS